MNEIKSVSSAPVISTHVNRETRIELIQEPVRKTVEEVTVIDTYNRKGTHSSVAREYTVSYLV